MKSWQVNLMDKTGRVKSLDATRGFDMFWIMGGEGLVCAIAAILGYPDFDKSFGHVPWDGLQFMDTIFPTFLFLAGVSFPFSYAKGRAHGMSDWAIVRKGFRRFVILSILGVLGALLSFKFATMRYWSVLGRIGFAWMCASWLYIWFGVRTRVIIAGLILVGVTLGTMLLIAPDAATIIYPDSLKDIEHFGRGPFSAAGNIGCWLDRTLTGGHTYKALFDPEGFSGALPAIVTAMLGVFAGEIIRSGNGMPSGWKVLQLLACAVFCAMSGLLLSMVCPINKALWSPSFTLVVGGYSFALFAMFYWIIDVKGKSRWSFFFQVVGMNSITIYMAQQFMGFNQIRDFFFCGIVSLFPTGWDAVVSSCFYILTCWLFLYFLYRKNIFLKI